MRSFEDFQAGETIDLGSYMVAEEEIIEFATRYDPQVFHIDPELAKDSFYGGLIASGWHTVAIYTRLLVNGLLRETKSFGSPGFDEVRWPRPVRPGDVLHGFFLVQECLSSRSRPNLGIVRSSCEMLNQHNKTVLTMQGVNFIGRSEQSDTH